MEFQSQEVKSPGYMKRIGFLRVLNEENTVIPCLLSVAPVLDHVVVLWADMDDRSIELIREWEQHLRSTYGCQFSFLHYPHHIVPPHSVEDLRSLPVESRIDTYLNFGMEFIRHLYEGQLFCVSKIDADQIYFTQELEEAFHMISSPEDCVSIRGYNTLVHRKRLMLYRPGPVNGGSDSLICGMNNLPHYGITAPYEVDITHHPHGKPYRKACWMHFMKTAKYKNIIREFYDDEVIPLSQRPALRDCFLSRILPLLQEAESPYAFLRLD